MMNRIALTLAVTVALAGCAMSDKEAPMAASPATEEAKAEADGQLDASNAPGVEAQQQRKLIQNAELHVEVAVYPEARRKLDELLASVGGFVADAQIEHHDGEVSRATLTLRIPSAELHTFLAETSGSGKILHERLTAQDITDSYYDIEARLTNAKRLEKRLLEILGTGASSMKDLLEVERELARVREEIERHEGRIRLWDQQVSLSTVKLELVTRKTYAAAPPVTLTERMSETLGDSSQALLGFGKALLLVVIALLPWLLPLALVAFGMRAAFRRITRRRAALAPMSPQGS